MLAQSILKLKFPSADKSLRRPSEYKHLQK